MWLLYGFDFGLGIALFLERERVVRALSALGAWVTAPLFALLLGVFSAPQLLGWHRPIADILATGIDDASSVFVTSVGALGLTAMALRVRWWTRALELRPVLSVGRISYSVYLLHFPVTILCAPLVPVEGGLSGWLVLCGMVIALTLPLSALSYRLVETPSVRLGNRLCRRIAARTRGAPLPTSMPGA